jgi:hypothetical protein
MKLSPLIALLALTASGAALAQLKPASQIDTSLITRTAGTATTAADDTTSREADARRAALGWLLLLDRRDWGTAWENAGQAFRTQVPIGAWMDGIPKVRDPLGNLQDREPAEVSFRTSLPGRPNGDYATVGYISKFSAKADAQEIITLVREADGRWRVIGYAAR